MSDMIVLLWKIFERKKFLRQKTQYLTKQSCLSRHFCAGCASRYIFFHFSFALVSVGGGCVYASKVWTISSKNIGAFMTLSVAFWLGETSIMCSA